MFKRVILLIPLFSFILAACGTLEVTVYQTPTADISAQSTVSALQQENAALSTAVATLDPISQPLTLTSTSEQIRQKMLRSATFWKTIWLDGTLSNITSGVTTREQVWLDQPGARFRLVSGPQNGEAAFLKVSDGATILEFDLNTGSRQTSTLAPGVAGQFVPQYTPGMASPNPLGGQIGSSLAWMAFSSDYAQNEGTFTPLRMEQWIGREALVVDWSYAGNPLPSWRIWLDADTGIMLKRQEFGKSGGETLQAEYVVNQLAFDPPNLPDDLFNVNPTSLPQFSDPYGQPVAVASPAPTVAAGVDPLGELYFFALTPGDDANGARLLRLPGSCVAGINPCPEAQVISLPAKTYANNFPTFAWNSDHSRAVYIASAGAPPSRLYLFDAAAETWNVLAEFPFLEIPMWSSDGNWIAFRIQDGAGNTDYYVVRPDGSGLKNVSASENLPAKDQPYIVDGWISNNLIVRSGKPGSESTVYLWRVDDGAVRPLFDTMITKAVYYPSPDGSLLALDDYNDTSLLHTLRIVAPDGSSLRDLATFKSAIYPIAWAADNYTLAFAVYAENSVYNSGNASRGANVYVMTRDGRGLMQVYTGDAISNMMFSPDGRFLVIDDGGLGRIFVINLKTLEVKALQPPNLSLNDWLREPAWK